MRSGNERSGQVLVIAYGNPLRCDDGIAWQAAEEIRRKLPSVTVCCTQQLTPELAEAAGSAGTVIFIDATRDDEPGTVSCRAVFPDSDGMHFSHNLKPAQVLALCSQLYGAEPRAFLISIGGQHFDHGEAISSAVINGVPRTVEAIEELLRELETQAACSPLTPSQ